MVTKRYLKISLKYFAAPVVLILVIVPVLLLSYRAYMQHRVREQTKIEGPEGIDSLEKVKLGGVEQWILIRGWNRANPVLLYLHGGPGAADIAIARYFDKDLERNFVMVHWDQRGAGKSYSPFIPTESMNIEQFVSDTHDLAEMLIRQFDVPKIYLVGHSWGSTLGILTAARYPELFYAFVGIGQFVNSAEQEDISYRFTLNEATQSGNRAAIRELEQIGPPPYADYKELLIERKWLEHFGGVHHLDIGIGKLMIMGLASPDYSLADCLKFFQGEDFSSAYLWKEGNEVNLFHQVPRIEVPIYFFIGRYDYNTPFEITERYYQQLAAPRGKQIIWFENSAHLIPYEAPEKFHEVLVNKVLKETYEGPEK